MDALIINPFTDLSILLQYERCKAEIRRTKLLIVLFPQHLTKMVPMIERLLFAG